MVPLTMVAALFLILFNWQDGALMGDDASVLELAFSMPAVSVETAAYLNP